MWKPGRFLDLQLVAGYPPRLWLDLVSSVVMASDQHTYRLIEETDDGHEVLFESRDRSQIVERIMHYMAHGLVAPDRHLTSAGEVSMRRGYLTGALILAWLSGLAVGILGLFVAGVILDGH